MYIYIITCISKVRTVVVYFVDFTTLFFVKQPDVSKRNYIYRFMGF